jgi:hypothetical protein
MLAGTSNRRQGSDPVQCQDSVGGAFFQEVAEKANQIRAALKDGVLTEKDLFGLSEELSKLVCTVNERRMNRRASAGGRVKT